MNILILGAGASYATHRLPIANQALRVWEPTIRKQRKLLAFVLRVWVGSDWPQADLEEAWTRIDVAWKERAGGASRFAVRELTDSERRNVRQLAREVVEPPGYPNYYRSQLVWARDYSPEQFLSVVAGWELRRLI